MASVKTTMTRMNSLIPIGVLLLAVLTVPVHAADDVETLQPSQLEFFEKKIRPVLIKHCYECHSSQSESFQGGLLLDSRAGIRKGGDSGAAIVPGDVAASILIGSIKYEDFEMPPEGKLTAAEINSFVTWVEMGAPDPRTDETATPTNEEKYSEASKLWSYQPITHPTPPTVTDPEWAANPIDRFVHTRLERAGLAPTSEALPVVLIRRLYIDLSGLPPTPAELAHWRKRFDERVGVSKNRGLSSDVTADLVDRLLDSPSFGERWGRHWLDLARYADSTGGGASNLLPDAWKYRDYVVRSFNEDKPYNQFVREQIAGDLLPSLDVEQRANNLTATGFLVLGPRNYITDDESTFHMDGIDEQIDSISKVFLGMSTGCARCHDHKFDPIPTKDYYALAGIFSNTQSYQPVPASKNFTWNVVSDPRDDAEGERFANYTSKTRAEKELGKEIKDLQRAVVAARETGVWPDGETGDSAASWITRQEDRIVALKEERAELKPLPAKPTTLMAVSRVPTPSDMHIRVRGNPSRKGEVVERGFFQMISHIGSDAPSQPQIPVDQSGRLQFAAWLTAAENPLPGRVIVNRLWHHLFGRALVATVDNFGVTGEAPSHPELLDWLAWQFKQEGWSVKRLVRRIVLSRTYQLGNARNGASGRSLVEEDPDNRLFGRHTRRAIDAEVLRDTLLMVSGELDLTPGGQPFSGKIRHELSHIHKSRKRSLYVPRFRNNSLELFRTFDAANPSLVVGRRDETIMPTQALYLINGDFAIDQARKSAERLLDSGQPNVTDMITLMYRRTLSRDATDQETHLARTFLDQSDTRSRDERLEAWAALQQTLFECIDFQYVR